MGNYVDNLIQELNDSPDDKIPFRDGWYITGCMEEKYFYFSSHCYIIRFRKFIPEVEEYLSAIMYLSKDLLDDYQGEGKSLFEYHAEKMLDEEYERFIVSKRQLVKKFKSLNLR